MKNTGLEIISYTDPYCTWCWGSEPILRKIQEVYGQQVRIRFVMGGLVEDMRKFSDPGSGIGGKLWYKIVSVIFENAFKSFSAVGVSVSFARSFVVNAGLYILSI